MRPDDRPVGDFARASGVHSPLVRRSACRRWIAVIRRSMARSRSLQPTQAPKTFSHTSIPRRSATRSGALRSDRGSSAACDGACAAARTSGRGSPRGPRCRRTIAPTRAGDRRSARAAASTRPRVRSRKGSRQLGIRLAHRVEEDAVGAELAHEGGDRLGVAHGLAARAGVPRVVVDEHPHAARLDRPRRARGCRERRGRSRTGCARRSRSRGRRARGRGRRSRRTRARPRRAAGRA